MLSKTNTHSLSGPCLPPNGMPNAYKRCPNAACPDKPDGKNNKFRTIPKDPNHSCVFFCKRPVPLVKCPLRTPHLKGFPAHNDQTKLSPTEISIRSLEIAVQNLNAPRTKCCARSEQSLHSRRSRNPGSTTIAALRLFRNSIKF